MDDAATIKILRQIERLDGTYVYSSKGRPHDHERPAL